MTLEQDLYRWDGSSSEDLQQIYSLHHKSPTFLEQIIAFSKQNDTEVGSTWLLKQYLESGIKVNSTTANQVDCCIERLNHWQAKLHILQSVPYLPITKRSKQRVEHVIRDCLGDDNKFVRAWAYNGFYELAKQYPALRPESRQFFQLASRDEAASVKARIRKITKGDRDFFEPSN